MFIKLGFAMYLYQLYPLRHSCYFLLLTSNFLPSTSY